MGCRWLWPSRQRFTTSYGTRSSLAILPRASSGASDDGTSRLVAPWNLMGRIVDERRLLSLDDTISDHLQKGLFESAVAQVSKLQLAEVEPKIKELLALMPFLRTRLTRMNPAVIAALARGVQLTAQRMIWFKKELEAANVESILGRRPSLLLDDEFSRIPQCLAALHVRYQDPADAITLVTEEPVLLVEDVGIILDELERYENSLFDNFGQLPSCAMPKDDAKNNFYVPYLLFLNEGSFLAETK